ncbi:MAG TPA: hypothetical protein VK158_03970 [Acidobacteriota bacterium]|nr:hypothetical protein [Acidobacteriota bacterium]
MAHIDHPVKKKHKHPDASRYGPLDDDETISAPLDDSHDWWDEI